MSTTVYEIKTGPEHHSGERAWMLLPSTVTVEARAVGERCCYLASTTDASALEAALGADDDVIEYDRTDRIRIHLDLTLEGRVAHAQLNGAIATALGMDDSPDLDWEIDPDTTDGWVVAWNFAESVGDVARYLESYFDVACAVNRVKGEGWWLWVSPNAS